MKKIVVINSFGPMGMPVIASIIEHLNYLNFHTMRKVGLNEYLINLKSLEDDFMKNNVIRKLSSFSENQITGGVSVLDRNKQSPKKRYDLNKVADELNVYKKNIHQLKICILILMKSLTKQQFTNQKKIIQKVLLN